MSYYWFNRDELLKKAHKKYQKEGVKERTSDYYQRNKETIRNMARNKHKNLSFEKKKRKKVFKK